MKNLYNKIYNAVNEGIQKALLINSEQNDVSVNYTYHKISNEANIINFLVNDLLSAGSDYEQCYNEILKYFYNSNNNRYIVKDIAVLNSIYLRISEFDNFTLDWIDTSNVIVLVKNDIEYPIYMLNKQVFNPEILKIKVKGVEPILLSLCEKYKDLPIPDIRQSMVLTAFNVLSYIINYVQNAIKK